MTPQNFICPRCGKDAKIFNKSMTKNEWVGVCSCGFHVGPVSSEEAIMECWEAICWTLDKSKLDETVRLKEVIVPQATILEEFPQTLYADEKWIRNPMEGEMS